MFQLGDDPGNAPNPCLCVPRDDRRIQFRRFFPSHIKSRQGCLRYGQARLALSLLIVVITIIVTVIAVVVTVMIIVVMFVLMDLPGGEYEQL